MKYTVVSIISIAVFLLVWEALTDWFHVFNATSLPSPVKVLISGIKKCYQKAPDGSTLGQHFLASLKLTTIAFITGGIVGTILGVITGWYKVADTILRPLVDFIRPIPPIALIPVMVIIFGIGFKARVSVIFFAVMNNMLLNTYAGIHETSDIHLWVSRTFGASNLQQLFTVALPSAKPMFFAGLRLAMSSAWMSVVAAEMLAASQGLGYMISINRTLARPDLVIVGMICLGLIGLAISKLFDLLEKIFVKGGVKS